MNINAPIAIFIYNRADHLQRTLASLLDCEGINESPIFIFADGSQDDQKDESIKKARDVAKDLLGNRASYHFSGTNKGLALSIIGGVETLLQQYGRVIVLEDDFELSPSFLTYMNAALERYANNEQVCQISGHNVNVPEFLDQENAVFLPLTTTWGWGTWQRAWQHFDPKATDWEQLAQDPALRKDFNFGGVYDYTSMLQRQMEDNSNSWGVRWYWSVFRREGITLFPPRSLVRNIGMDETGTHGGGLFRSFDKTENLPITAPTLPDCTEVVPSEVEAVRRAIWQQNGRWVGYSVDQLKKMARGFKRFRTKA